MSSRDQTPARVFRRLHEEGLLVLANAWDAGSARLIESLGAKAIATTSCGVAWSHGYADGNCLPVPRLVATIAEIARVVKVPLTADVEAGYSSDPASVADTVARVLDAGAVGINLEDGAGDPDLLCAKIEAVRGAAARVGVEVFVNARTDVYLRGLAPAEGRVASTLERAARYRAAGADGIFVPGVVDAAEIQSIASSAPMPLNVMARSGLPPAAALQALGVRRLSSGGDLAEAAFGRVASLAKAFLGSGASEPLIEGAMSYAEINALMPAP